MQNHSSHDFIAETLLRQLGGPTANLHSPTLPDDLPATNSTANTSNQHALVPVKKRSRLQRASPAWKYFEKLLDPTNKHVVKVQCLLCTDKDHPELFSSGTSTGTLLKHLRRCHRDTVDHADLALNEDDEHHGTPRPKLIHLHGASSSAAASYMSEQQLRQAYSHLVLTMAGSHLPLSMITSDSFAQLCRVLNRSFVMPKRSDLIYSLESMYSTMSEKMATVLASIPGMFLSFS